MSDFQQGLRAFVAEPGYVIDEAGCMCVGIAMRNRLMVWVSAPRMNLLTYHPCGSSQIETEPCFWEGLLSS
jgi:hypothetical protein